MKPIYARTVSLLLASLIFNPTLSRAQIKAPAQGLPLKLGTQLSTKLLSFDVRTRTNSPFTQLMNSGNKIKILPSPEIGENEGGADAGGGDAINYKIIESYMFPLKKIAGYQEFIVPVMADLKSKLPILSNKLSDRILEMNWYQIPVSLKKLAQKYTGLPFATNQLTVQKLKSSEVFIDEEMFKAINDPVEQGRHLLHEILENYLMNECLKMGTKECDSQRDMYMGMVRVTVNILTESASYNSDELSDLLKQKKWGDYLTQTAEEIEKRKQENFEKREKEKQEIAAALPEYRVVSDYIFGAVDSYCKSVGHLGITYSQIYQEINSREEEELKKELTKLSFKTILTWYKLRMHDLETAPQNGIKTTDVLPFYKEKAQAWAREDFRDLDQMIPARNLLSERPLRGERKPDLVSYVVELHNLCKKLPELKDKIEKRFQVQ
jgi:hypothetical protein